MHKLDWYILKKLFVTFFFCMFLFTLIAVAVDSSEKTDDFVKSGLSTAQIIKQYYFGFVPYIWGLLFPLFVFIAVIFFTSRMASRAEVVAILASGVSYNRFLRPYFVGGFTLAFGLWLASRYVIPKAQAIRSEFQSKYIDPFGVRSGHDAGVPIYKRVDPNTYVGFRYYDTAAKTASGFYLDRVKDNKVVYNLRADNMKWDTATRNWKLVNATERTIDGLHETVKVRGQLHLNLNMKPEDLLEDEYVKDKLSTPKLRRYIDMEALRGSEGLNALRVELYRRTATPVTVLLLTLIGVVVSSRRVRGGSGLHLAIGIVIAVLFILCDRFSTVFSIKGDFPPLIAAWLPDVVFSGVAYYLYRLTPK
ncbi:MAG TPA: LptF/LptG family permease [Chitinophagaceae bacterium]|jgi:lipopolysaccharide export system permease protein